MPTNAATYKSQQKTTYCLYFDDILKRPNLSTDSSCRNTLNIMDYWNLFFKCRMIYEVNPDMQPKQKPKQVQQPHRIYVLVIR